MLLAALPLLLLAVVLGPLAPFPRAAGTAAAPAPARLPRSPACFLGCGPSLGSCEFPEEQPGPVMAWISVRRRARPSYSV